MRSRGLILGVLVGAVMLGGCEGSPAPTAPGTPTPPVVSATPTGTPSVPVLPEAAEANTKAGAVAFVRHYVDAVNHAQATGDVGHLHELASNDCGSCRGVESAIDKVARAGGHSEGGAWHLAKVERVFPNPSVHGWLVLAFVKVERHRVWLTSTAEPTVVPAESRMFSIQAGRQGSRWEVTRWTRAN